MKYTLKNLNVVKTVDSENARDRLIAKGFILIGEDAEMKNNAVAQGTTEGETEEDMDKSADTDGINIEQNVLDAPEVDIEDGIEDKTHPKAAKKPSKSKE